MDEIIRFQRYMLLIRRAAGWSAEEFGDRIGVTRQTINNLEKDNRNKFKLTKTQYIAMRSVLDAEIINFPDETETLRLILDMLVDHPEKYRPEDIQTLLDKANMITPSILAGTATRRAVSKEIMGSMGAVLGSIAIGAFAGPLGPLIAGGLGLGSWLVKVVSSEKNKK